MGSLIARNEVTKQSQIDGDCFAGIWGSYLEGGHLGNRIARDDNSFANALSIDRIGIILCYAVHKCAETVLSFSGVN
jgi:hypothetical protein